MLSFSSCSSKSPIDKDGLLSVSSSTKLDSLTCESQVWGPTGPMSFHRRSMKEAWIKPYAYVSELDDYFSSCALICVHVWICVHVCACVYICVCVSWVWPFNQEFSFPLGLSEQERPFGSLVRSFGSSWLDSWVGVPQPSFSSLHSSLGFHPVNSYSGLTGGMMLPMDLIISSWKEYMHHLFWWSTGQNCCWA